MIANYTYDDIREKVERQLEADRRRREVLLRYTTYAIAIVSGICALVCVKKVSENNRLMRSAVSRVNNLASVDVPTAIIDEAVENAANYQIEKAVKSSVDRVRTVIDQEARKRVQTAVTDRYDVVSDSVIKALKKEVLEISAEDIAEEVREAAKEELIDVMEKKLDDIIDDISDSYKRNLDSVGKIYDSMAKRMTHVD